MSNAFAACTSLTSITIPASVTSIGDRAFGECTSLTSITVNSGNQNYASEGGILYNKAKTTLIAYPSASGNVMLPSGLTEIVEWAFSWCTSLTSITIPAGVTSIGEDAFYYCSSLTSITIPNSITSIGDGAFRYTGLTSITIPASLTSIGEQAFAGCTRLTSITIPNSVTSIGDGAFSDWTSSQTIYIKGKASQAEADAIWGWSDNQYGHRWRRGCEARIIYG